MSALDGTNATLPGLNTLRDRSQSPGPAASLVHTKTAPPTGGSALLRRDRLLVMAEQVHEAGLLLVRAPAGYGKTSLLRQWEEWLRRQGAVTRWLSLDEHDTAAHAFLDHLIAALCVQEGALRQRLWPTLQESGAAAHDVKTVAILNELALEASDTIIFLDDVHTLADTPAEACLARLVEQSPAGVHWVLATREPPRFGLSRLRAQGRLREVLQEDLRFDAEEAARFIDAAGATSLAPSERLLLQERTEGWVAGLKLACLALRHQPNSRGFIESFSGRRRDVADYFADEVLQRQSEEVRHFLLRTSVLDRLTASLCAAVTQQPHAHRLLAEVEEAGLFLTCEDSEGGWFRYHAMFAEFLQRRLAEAGVPRAELLLSASRWHAEQGNLIDAFYYARDAQAWEWAGDLLERYCQSIEYVGTDERLHRLAHSLPREVLRQRPELQLTVASQLILEWRFDEAQDVLEQVSERLANASAHVRWLTRFNDMLLHQIRDEMPRSQALCEQLVAEDRDAETLIKGILRSSLLITQREQFRLEHFESLDAEARRHYEQTASATSRAYHAAIVGIAHLLKGDAIPSEQVLRHGLDEAMSSAGTVSSLAAIPALPLAMLLYDRDEVTAAMALLDRYLDVACDYGFLDQLTAGHFTKVRWLACQPAPEVALSHLDEVDRLVRRYGFERLRMQALAERMRVLQRLGRQADVHVLAREAALPAGPEGVLPQGPLSAADEWRALAWTRANSQRLGAEAVRVARHWRALLERRGFVRNELRWELVLAQLHREQGDDNAARRHLLRALETIARTGYLRMGLDEGPALLTLLPTAGQGFYPSSVLAMADRLRALSGASPAASPASSAPFVLCANEARILSLVASGLRNRDVAEAVCMTEGSVKWYLHQVYDKMSVSGRKEAVAEARRLGLI